MVTAQLERPQGPPTPLPPVLRLPLLTAMLWILMLRYNVMLTMGGGVNERSAVCAFILAAAIRLQDCRDRASVLVL